MAEIDVAIQAARAGGAIICSYFRRRQFDVHVKFDRSLQTSADLESERKIVGIIKDAFPSHSINSEELDVPITGSSSYRWLIDPLDGTDNFVLGIPYFSLSIALCNGELPVIGVIYDPINDELYSAEKGKGASRNGTPICVSRTDDLQKSKFCFIPDFATKLQGKTLSLREALYKKSRRLLDTWSPALDWCLVASGRIEGVVVVGSKPVEANAGTLILEEAKGRITDFCGNVCYPNKPVCMIGTNGRTIHNELLQLIDEHYN